METPPVKPYVDEAMLPLLQGHGVTEADVRTALNKRLAKLYAKQRYPLYGVLGVPKGRGDGIRTDQFGPNVYKSVPGVGSFDVSARGGLITARGSTKKIKKYVGKGAVKQLKKKIAKGKISGFMDAYRYLKGSGPAGGKLTRKEGESDEEWASRVKKYRKYLKALYYYTKRLSPDVPSKKWGKEYYKAKQTEAKLILEDMDPEFGKKVRKPRKPRKKAMTMEELINPNPAATGFKKKYRTAVPTGGFLGAILSLAAPLIKEGISWIARKISKKSNPSASGIDDLIQRSLVHKRYYTSGPDGNLQLWKEVYKAVREVAPAFFEGDPRAESLAKAFALQHRNQFFRREKGSWLHGGEDSPSVGDVAVPLIEGVAEQIGPEMGPEDVESIVSGIEGLPESQEPIGSGILDSIIGLLKSDKAKSLMSSVAKAALPKIVGGIEKFVKSRMGRISAKHPKLAEAASSVIEPIAKEVKTAVLDKLSESNKTLTASGYGGTTATDLEYDPSYADSIMGMAKKTNSV